MEVLHTDLYGPVDPSLGGSKYALMLIDEATCYRVIAFMTHKSATATKMKELVSELRRITGGMTIRRIHSDNGKEFLSKELMDYYAEQGIMSTSSGDYCPEENGTAERNCRTTSEQAI